MIRWTNARSSIVLGALLCACKQRAPTPRVEPEQHRVAPARDVVDPPPDTIVERAPSPPARLAIEPIDAETQRDSSADAAESEDASQTDAIDRRSVSVRNAPYRLDLEEEAHCDLRLGEQGLSTRCSEGTMTCRQLLTGDFTASGAPDTVWDCLRAGQRQRFVVLSTARAVAWADKISREDEFERHSTIREITAETFAIGAHPLPAIFLRVRHSQISESYSDHDKILLWRNGALQALAEASYQCDFDGARTMSRVGDGIAVCSGDYIVPNAAGTGVNFVGHRARIRQLGIASERLMIGNGHIQRRLTWARMLAGPSDPPL